MNPGRRGPAVALGLTVDRLVGEPPAPVHPVALFGRVMSAVEHRWWRDTRTAGAVHALAGVTLGAVAGAAAGTAAAVALSAAGRMLRREATSVADALDAGDLNGARRRLRSLCGRDVDGLDATGVARAAVESVAENTVDAVVAPAFWGLVGGGPAVGVHRAVNTLDAMVGHRTDRYERFGWASARLDDLMAFVPARMVAAAVAALRPGRAADVLTAVMRDAPAHPSPNAGVAEAAFAAALGVRLGGPVTYAGRPGHRPVLGRGREPTAADIRAAVRLSDEVERLVVLVAGVVA